MTPAEPTTPLTIWIAYNDASNGGNHELAAKYISPDLAVLINGEPGVGSAEEDQAIQSELIRCYPNYARVLLSGLEDGDRAAVEWRMQGTPAPRLDMPPLDVPGCSLVRCVGGRIVEARLYHPTGALDLIANRALGRG